ncbi:hypothetical protein QQ965_01650 [Candidatus Saccharibacteria bacterium oral taxon 955]
MDHLSELLLDLCNPLRKAAFFGAIFNKLPTYDEINFGAHKNSSPPEVNELFQIRTEYKSLYGEPTNINVELLFRDLFALRDRFKELGMVIKNGEVYLPDLEESDV